MDLLDRKILALYQHDVRRPAERIGAEVGLSAAAVQRRLKRMRASGVIRAEVALLDPAEAGSPVTCVALLAMASRPGPRAHLDRFKEDMRREPRVQQCYHVTGERDLVLVVSAASMEDYGEFVRRWIEGSDAVVRYDTFVVLDAAKVGLAVPLP
jgi:DNA-binding Lrp family transcriptional regulator